MVLPDVLAILKKRSNNPTSFHLRKLRKSLEDKDGASVDHSGFFDGVQRRCIKIPRRILDKELLELIDKACGRDCNDNGSDDTDDNSDKDTTQEEVDNLKRKLGALEEHNRSLISDKRELEEFLASKRIKFARTEEKLKNLERDMALTEKQWKIKEKELNSTG